MDFRIQPTENKEEQEPNEEFSFFTPRMIEEMHLKVIKKGLEIEFVNKAKRGLRNKELIW